MALFSVLPTLPQPPQWRQPLLLLALLLTCTAGVGGLPATGRTQVAFEAGHLQESGHDASNIVAIKKDRKLKGRFLHLTDMHPDPFYRIDGTESSACHRRRPRKEKERGGRFGLPFGDCDSPLLLTNFTLDHLEKHWAKEVDFVIWTGDSARHDNDRQHPRTPNEIYDLNRAMVQRMEDIFTRRGIPVIPSIGNNDIWPHNILAPGPNSITNEFSSIWRNFIPFESFQVFQRGGYFSVEVVQDELAVVSLNTLYFYDSNKAVGGCEYGDQEDPGNLQFDWLEVQLESYRERGMQVWMSGHVPASPGNYFPGCFVRYAEVSLRFQDTILGHLFGHMNVDHFFFLHMDDLQLPEENGLKLPSQLEVDGVVEVQKHSNLAETLMRDFGALPKAKKTDLDEYAIINVSPSVVPNPYLPSFRVFAYNISDVEDKGEGESLKKKKKKKKKGRDHGHRHPDKGKKVDCSKKANRDSWACRPKKPFYADEDSPSRRNQLWTPLGYAQYWMPMVEEANAGATPKYELEYTTLELDALHPAAPGSENSTGTTGKGEFVYPIPLKRLPRALREYNGTATKKAKRYAPYRLADLTVGSWVRFARRLGDERREKLRGRFARHMYMGGEE